MRCAARRRASRIPPPTMCKQCGCAHYLANQAPARIWPTLSPFGASTEADEIAVAAREIDACSPFAQIASGFRTLWPELGPANSLVGPIHRQHNQLAQHCQVLRCDHAPRDSATTPWRFPSRFCRIGCKISKESATGDRVVRLLPPCSRKILGA